MSRSGVLVFLGNLVEALEIDASQRSHLLLNKEDQFLHGGDKRDGLTL